MSWPIYAFFVAMIWPLSRPWFGNTSKFGGLEGITEQTRWRGSAVQMVLAVLFFSGVYVSNCEEEPLLKISMSIAAIAVTLMLSVARWRKPRKEP